jgi:hypothetical protein
MLDKYIDQLIDRMLDNSDYHTIIPYDSSKSISWKALREAETLTDHKYINNIIENIGTEKNKKRREYMYFTVGRICEKNPYQKGLEFIIDRLDKETDKYVLSSMLDRIEWLQKSAETDLSKIIECLSHKTWQVRYSAITALRNTNNFIVDDLMIAILNDDNSEKHSISYALGVVYNCGTDKCFAAVEKQTHNKSRIIKAEAKETLRSLKEKYNIK